MWGSEKGRRRAARTAVALLTAAVLAVAAGCGSTAGPDGPAGADVHETAPELAALMWDARLVPAAGEGALGWLEGDGTAAGELVQLTDSESVRDGLSVLWRAPDGLGARIEALDLRGERALITLDVADGVSASGMHRVAAIAGVAGSYQVGVPEGFEFAGGAFAGAGELVVVAQRLTAASIETTLGAIAQDGTWRPLELGGTVPAHQFVERLLWVEGTDAFALVLKTEGTPAPRDDEALVLATLDGGTLSIYTPPFSDDSLPSACALRGEEGVVFARTWRETAGAPVVDLVRARFDGAAWSETVLLAAAPIANGLETGQVALAAQDGTLWLRAAARPVDGEGRGDAELLRLPEGAAVPEGTGLDIGAVSSLWWMGE